MNEDIKARKVRRWFFYTITTIIGVGACVGILYGMRPLILPFILGAFLAYLFKPLAKSFQGPHWSKYVRLAGFMVAIFVVFSVGIRALKQSLPNEKEKLELKVRLQYRLNERYASWMGLDKDPKGNFIYQKLGEELDPIKLKAIEYVKLSDDDRKLFLKYRKGFNDELPISDRYFEYYLKNLETHKVSVDKLKEQVESTSLSSHAPNGSSTHILAENGDHHNGSSGTLAALMKTFTNWIIFPLVFMFFLTDKGQIMHFFMRLVPNRYFELANTVVENVDEALGKYIRGTLIECLLVGITLAIGFVLCGLELEVAIFIGALGGLTNAIPFVGTFIACIVGAAYSLIAENVDSVLPFVNENNLLLAVIGVVMIAHLFDNAIFQPLVVGSAVSLHPIVVVMGVFGGSMMFGFAGLLLAIPTIVIVTVVTKTLFTGLKDYNII